MKQKKLLPGQFVFGIFTCLLIPAEILAFYFDVPAAFLYAPFSVTPLYLLLSALAHFPVQKAIGLWACALLPPAVICSRCCGYTGNLHASWLDSGCPDSIGGNCGYPVGNRRG